MASAARLRRRPQRQEAITPRLQEGLWAYFKLPSNVYDWTNIGIFWAVLGARNELDGIWQSLATQARPRRNLLFPSTTISSL